MPPSSHSRSTDLSRSSISPCATPSRPGRGAWRGGLAGQEEPPDNAVHLTRSLSTVGRFESQQVIEQKSRIEEIGAVDIAYACLFVDEKYSHQVAYGLKGSVLFSVGR